MVPWTRCTSDRPRDPMRPSRGQEPAIAGLREAVLATGFEARDLQTSQVNLHPTYDREGRINGHQASLGMRITVRDIAGSGVVIDAVTAGAGAHARLSGSDWITVTRRPSSWSARQAAVADARVERSRWRCWSVANWGAARAWKKSSAHMAPRMMAARSMPTAEMVVDGGRHGRQAAP